MIKSAKLSPDKKYRYSLSRIWDDTLPAVVFIGLNPSTADAEKDDPTIRKCIGFAKRWGFGAIHMVNLMAYRSTDKNGLLEVRDPVGKDNSLNVRATLALPRVEKIVPCWGNPPKSDQTAYSLRLMWNILKQTKPGMSIQSIGTNQSGHPKHPLYLSYEKGLIDYKELFKELISN